jgi:glycyl-tRNA synthetase
MSLDMQSLVTFAKTKGFVYPGSDIYGGLANSWDYGPLGSLMKENIKNLWIKNFVQKRKDMTLLDAAILMNPQVWVASGHVGGFSDPLIDDKKTKERFRADKLLEDLIEKLGKDGEPLKTKYGVPNLVPESWSLEKQAEVMRGESVKNPNTGEVWDWTEVRKFNLMFQTNQGITQDSSTVVYMRPETAQWIFVNFPNIARSSRKKVPFWVAQVGKAFRNEITPGNFIFRTREFEQMEIEYFCEPENIAPGKHLELHAEWKMECKRFLTDVIWLKEENLRLRDHEKEELSHYSAATTDIEFKFPFGWGELWGIADRTDFDLKAHMNESKQDLSYFDPYTNTKYIPYVIEPSVGLTRLFLATLANAYDEITSEEGTRVVMRFAPAVAPIKVAVYPLVKKFADQANALYSFLSEHFVCEYDEAGTIGKRYQRSEEMGIPYAIAVEPENYDQGQVTVRDRDTGVQEIVKIADLVLWLKNKGC